MTAPPPYPRTPHLWAPAGRSARTVLDPDEAERWLREPVVVEEKLDGANVAVWLERGVQVASRGGAGAQDRGGQLGRLRAWANERLPALESLLSGGWALYGEWLWLQHGIHYDRLPDWLVVLDLWRPDVGFSAIDERDRRATDTGFVVPPRLFAGVPGTPARVRGLIARSAFSTDATAEGLVLRAVDGRRCKVVGPGHVRRSDDEWVASRAHNEIVGARS